MAELRNSENLSAFLRRRVANTYEFIREEFAAWQIYGFIEPEEEDRVLVLT